MEMGIRVSKVVRMMMEFIKIVQGSSIEMERIVFVKSHKMMIGRRRRRRHYPKLSFL